jgi:hypothetical protein
VTILENVDAIHSLILDDRRISATKIAETLSISLERVGYTYYSRDFRHEKGLNAEQKRDRVLASQAVLHRSRRDAVRFLNRDITTDETWIHIYEYDPEAKEQC